ncbi:MAG: hypothetical protein IRY99_22885, partial [Isosphaeraceae bacterium]|nr:hypothetical protein [Isosphaeraceae bacterium]
VVVGALAASPASPLEMSLARWFRPYYGLADMGYAYRFYSPEPPPTPVLTATLTFADGSERKVRLPDRSLRPRLLYQRQMALANTLYVEVDAARREPPMPGHPHDRWARAFARHLCRLYEGEGCKAVTLHAQMHLVPELERVREALSRPGASGVDLDAEEFYTVPEWIGDYSCDAF